MCRFLSLLLVLLLVLESAVQAEDSAIYSVDLGFSVNMNVALHIEQPSLDTKILFFQLNTTSPLLDLLLKYGRLACSSSLRQQKGRAHYETVNHSCKMPGSNYDMEIKYQNNIVDTVHIGNITRSNGHNFAIFKQSTDFLTAFMGIAENTSMGLAPGNWQVLGAYGVNFYSCRHSSNSIEAVDSNKPTKAIRNIASSTDNSRNILCVCRRVANFSDGLIVSGDCGSVQIIFGSDFFPLSMLWNNEGKNWQLQKQMP